jgi:hypothetical protein
MKIFVSSLISNFESFRAAARSAITTLGHEPVMAEDFGASPNSPQIACLQQVRECDAVVLVLGERYGTVQDASGLAPTHEEFREARERKPVFVFVQEGVHREPLQETFVAEVQAWHNGYFRAGFSSADELRGAVTRALHDYELANAAGPLDPATLVTAAEAQIPRHHRNHGADTPTLHLSIAGGPAQRILRPAQLEAPELGEFIQQQAQFGTQRIFDKTKGAHEKIEADTLLLVQDGGAHLRLSENGAVLLTLPLEDGESRQYRDYSLFAIIEESVLRRLVSGLGFANLLLDHVDGVQRLTHVAIASSIEASGYMGWRTRAEQDSSPNSGTIRMGDAQLPPVSLHVARAKLRMGAHELAEDLMVKLRRQRK